MKEIIEKRRNNAYLGLKEYLRDIRRAREDGDEEGAVIAEREYEAYVNGLRVMDPPGFWWEAAEQAEKEVKKEVLV